MNSAATLTDLTPAQRLELLKLARARKLVGDRLELPPIEPAAREGRLPLSFAQERLWFIDRLEPGSAVYNLSAALRLTGALDERAVERGLGEIVRRHEALRTTFAEVDGAPVQVIAPFAGFTLPVEDLSDLGDADRQAAAGRRAGEEARRPFDLAAGPLFRAVLLRLGAQEHVLLLGMHHVVSDGWSMGVLSREFSVLYAAYRDGRESPLPELAVQYADYAVWQRENLRGPVLERQLAYWRERLAGAPELLELPTDRPRPAVQTFRGAHEPIALSGELLERLRALGRQEGATLYMVALSAFQLLLSKYGGSDDVVVGSPIAGRTRGEVEGLIGFFVNTLVLRTDLSGDPSFRELLGRVREVTLGAYEHQDVTFEKLVAELSPERSLSHSPLFQVAFTLDNAQDTGGGVAGLGVQGVGTEFEVAKFDLSLGLSETAQGLRGGLAYSTDLFERGTIVRMLGHLQRVLEQVAANPDVRLSGLELPAGEERRLLLEAWGRSGEAPDAAARCVHELFAEQAARTPDAVALACGDETLTYAQLHRRSGALARRLAALGVGPEVRVGICVERGVEMVVALLGILQAGGAYVPLDPQYPAERLAYMLADAGAALLLTQERLRDRLPAFGGEVVVLDGDGGDDARSVDPSARGSHAVLRAASPENLAYVIYTSGSTGLPKGTEVPHRAIPGFFRGAGYARFGEGAVVLQHSSVSWDALTLELWPALLSGGTCVLYPGQASEPGLLGEQVRRHGVNTLWLTAAYFNLIVDTAPEILEGVAQVMTGGEAVSVTHLRRALELYPRLRLVNGYGPSETTVFATCHPVPAGFAAPSVPVGRPVGDRRVYLLDRHFCAVPRGAAGEVCIGGPAVARGYLGRPALTAERFIPDPFGEPGARLYRSGDRARWGAEGELEFGGRVDFQVKIRGFRVEPGEVEAVLRACPGVREAAVVVREDAPGDRRLVAYVAGEAAADEVRAHVRRSLPEYMVPAAFVFLDALPLTTNGKVDRRALPAPDLASARDRYVAPRTPVEEVLAGIWAEVLKVERVGVEESFFELGGHSLLATRVVSRVREVFAIELPLRALFEGPTVAELAGRVEAMRRAGLPVLPPVVRINRDRPLPLSFAQERLWFIDRLEPGSAVYNIPAALRLAGALDEPALERALSEIVRRHESLRTTFIEADNAPVQVIAPFGGFALPLEDLSALAEADREAAVGRRAGEEAARPFDLAAGPLFRAALLRLGEEEHVLLLSMHHIVSDGWSMGVFARELSALYAVYREGRASPLPELAVQYADYAVWQREQLAGETLDRQLAYWTERLADAPALLELPTDRPRPAVQTYRGASVPVELAPELLDRLQALGRSEGATLYMTVLSAFQVLLGRYAGSEDIVVGSPIAGRTRGEVEALIGFFVNTLVLRTDLSGDPSFRELLRRVRAMTLGAYEHQDVPFEKLVAELQPERSLSHAPLFQVSFALQDTGDRGDGLQGLKAGGAGAAIEIAKFDLSLTLTATSQGLRGGLNYATDLFERGTVERMLGHLARVLEQVAEDADVRLSRLELLGGAERALVLEEWNRTDADVPADVCIHELFEAQADRTPGAVAVRFEAESLTYGALNALANRLAHHLRALGVGPDARVGICVERGPEMVAGLLAILKAGGAYVPLDPAYPADRLRYMLEDSAPAALVTQSTLAGAFAGLDVPVVEMDAPAAPWAQGPETNPARAGLTPDHLAYVIYTSGSTGRPKGVMVEHRSLVNHTAWQAAAFGIGAGDTVLQRTSVSFDASVWELWTPLATGARMLLLSSDAMKDPAAIGRVMAEGGVTVAQFVPLLLQAVLGALPADVSLPIRVLFCGGEPLSAALVDEACSAGVGEVVNLYGPTEATIDSTWHPSAAGDGRAPAIGRPIANARMYVLDARGAPAPVGVAGELYVGGAGVARGYLGRAGLTAERFVPDPFSANGGARMYRTGDRGRWRADGTLEFLGRTDFQVKVRGFRIELGEVEAALLGHAGVRECVVVAREDVPGEKRLVAYVVGGAEAGALREHLRRELPEYMVPSAFVPLDALPLAPNGKLDRKALPAPDFAPAEERYVAPRTPTEEVLAEIWAETLRRDRVGVTESFFALGGHSLLATRVVSRVRQVFGVEVPLRALFEGPTVAELAGRVEEMRRAGLPVLPPVVPAGRTGALPLSFAQERLWFIDRLEPGSAVYNMPAALRLAGALDPAAMERALGEIVRRHEALRTTFGQVDGSPVQVIAPFGGFALPLEDLSALGDADREAAVRQRAGEEARRAFDLSAGPLFRAALLRLEAEEHVLLLSMHHIVSDGWSMGVFFRELSALYEAYRDGRESPLPELAVQYADYALWQREQLAGEVLERQLAYWKERLADAPALLELPIDHPRPAVQTYRGAAVPVELAPELLERLRALGRGEGATLYMTLLAAFQVLLGKYAGSEDVVVGSPIAGRTRAEVEELIGFFVNTLVLRTDLGGDPSFRDVLRRVREATLGAYAHQEVPFEKLVAELQPERSLSHAPLFQVMFTLQDAGGGGGALQGLKAGAVGAEMEIAKFDLSLTLAATPQGLLGGLNYATDLFERGTVERMLGHLARVLEQVAADADVRLSELELLGEAERALVLETWNPTGDVYPADLCIHERFETQADRTPDAVAIVYEGEALTYAELNARANQLAHFLRRRGVGPEVRVGICLERSLEMVVGILAVLKAGGAYVPLDPAYPADRLAFTLSDAGVPVLLAQEKVRAALPVPDGVELISLDAAQAEIAAESTENPASGATPESLAYVIYTSGSTGAPKGALIEHRNVARLFSATDAWFGFGPDDVWTLFHSYAFDFSVWELWGALLYGGRVVVVPVDVSRDPEAFHALVRREGVTVLNQTPSAFRQFMRVDAERGGELALRVVVFGGEALEPASLREWVERRGIDTPRLVNMYGITETTVHVTYRPLGREDVFGGSGSPIGRAIPDLRLYVLDPARRPVPVGVPGELYVGGAGVARGYLNRPELTAQRFVENPFGAGALYRTGDRVRWMADGTLEYLGRLDEQVKIRGFRIELGEIEAALRQADGVSDCTVLVREDEGGDRRLVAYVVGDADAEALRDRLRQGLPEYMVPSAFVFLDALPLTANGKLDRKALPAPEYAADADRYVAPRTPTEQVLAGIWAEVLKLERVGVHDNFFALGGHSLLAVTLVERMRRQGVRVDVRALFTTPTVAELAAAAGGDFHEVAIPPNRIPAGCGAITPDMLPLVELTQAEIDRIVAGVPGGAENVQDIYPLAPLQEGVLFHHLLTPESDPYLLPQPFAFASRERLDAYLAALRAAVARHDILRTAAVWEGLSEPVQVVWRDAPLIVQEVEVDPAAGDVARQLYARVDPLHYHMDLGRAPLVRAYVGREAVAGRWGLLLLLHHMVSDHTTADVLREEMEAHLDGRAEQLPAPLPFRNYVAQARLGVSRAEHEAFFRELLGDVDEPTAPFGLREVRGDGLGLEQELLRVDEALGVRLRERARRLGVSTAAVCHVACAQVLARVSGRSDVVFGTVLFGRMEGGEGADRVLGPFINTLPVRIRVGDEGAEASVRRTQALLASLVRHEHASLALAQQYSGVPAPEPLFSALFNYRYAGAGDGAGGGNGSTHAPSRALHVMERSNYPLNLAVNDWGDAFSVSVQVEPEVGAKRVCALMHAALAGLVEALEEAPERPLGHIEVLPRPERRQVLEAWNGTDADYPADRCIHALFEAQADRTPDAVAVVFEQDSLTYAELNERANRLAHHLRGLGVGPDARVGVCLERSLEMVVGILAVLKAGGAYVPLDPGLPAERLAYMLDDSGVPLVLVQAALRGVVPARDGVQVLAVDALADRLAAEPAENPAGGAGPDSLAYVIYTSGSTGRPKGVMNVHRGVVNLLWSMRGTVAMAPADRLLAVTTLAFDISVLELFLPLLSGARVEILDRAAASDPALLRAAIGAGGGTVLQATPATWRLLLDAGWEGAEHLRALSGGEALPAELAIRLRERVGALWNVYGPTETTIWSTAQRLGAAQQPGAGTDLGRGHVSIGAPVANTRVYVLDRYLSPVPAGVPGELYIGGAGVARGYLGRPGLSAEKFVPDPFAVEPGARVYRTGDLARWRPDGTLEFLGRNDHQVKVRGYRIELGEIEAVLRQADGVRDCAVAAREDETGDRRLAAYVVGEAEAEALRAHVRQGLPEYMVPSAFVFLDALPLTPNGKLDRKALPAPEYAAGADRYVAPRTPAEEVLAGIWAEVLRLERVGAEESFFELGGHSLLATRVAARVRAVFGVELPLRAVFERPVLAGLAAEIERLRGSGAAAAEDAIAPAARAGDLPATFAQERLWFVDALDPGSPVYAIPFSYRLTGRLDADALRRALAELVRRHEPLRTTLPAVDGVPVQRIAPAPAAFDLSVTDLRHLPDAERRAVAGRLAAEASRHRFELARGPLFRASLVHVADDEQHLHLNLHHAIGDGWSLGVLVEELSALYGAFSRGEASPLPEPALQYADYAVWQRERLSGATLERQVEFWRQALDGAPALLELPTDRPRPPVESHRGAVERLVVPSGLAAEVNALARREGATLFMVLLAALDVVLGRLAGQEDVVVGTPIAGRTRAETDRMIGLFLNSLALRTDLSGDPSFRELLGRVRETTLSAYAHQDVPFERVLEEVRPERSLSHAPVFQVMLNLANFQDGAFQAEGLDVAGGGTGGELPSKFDLTLYVGEGDGGIVIHLVYAADLFDAARMRELLAQLQGVLRQAAAAPETRVGALSLATDAARGVLPDPAEPLDATWRGAVHEVFAAQARRTPDALAVEDPRERWTYAELDAATDGVARALADAGVGVGDVVAITGHRSAALVRALVGTIKSGAAFLVLDPAYPAARLGDYVRIARPAAHLHLAAAADLPGEVMALLDETIRTRLVLRPRDGRAAEEVDGIPSSPSPVSVDVGPDTLAYLSFTSGTTGTPKAVMGRHSSLTHFTPWLAQRFGLGAADRYSLLSGLAHDPLHRDVFTPLQTGAAVVAPLPDEVGTPGYLARWMREAGITVAHLTPAMGQLLADAAEGERIDSLHRAFFVGDVLRRADVQRLAALAPNLRVVNYYGSTETQRAVSYHVVHPDAEQKEIIPLGCGIPGVQLLVRNASGEIAGIGEVGEIWMRSPHLAAGYLNDPALAAERFLVNPWTGDPADRLYRTGDLGRYRPDGEVEPMGRADQQVKVRGFRVELGEVESALASHPSIREAAVIAREADAGDRRLVAYWVPVEGSVEPEIAALRAHLKALLPEYMVPSAYVRLDRLPLTANGKLDRRALPEPESAGTDARPAAPRTPTEEILAQLWAEVLRLESVGVDDDFFALGGHSLLATRLLSRVQNALGVVLPLRALFEGPTVAELAVRVEEMRRAGLPVLPPVVRIDRDRPLPLSFAQERLWFLDRLEGGSASYNQPAVLRLGGALDVHALERSLGEIVRRHESLRTVFREAGEGAVQVIAPFGGFALPVDDLSGLDGTACETEVRRRAREDAARPFDLAQGPLFRAALLRLADEEHVLLLCIHHIVTDGWSTGVLHRELSALYAAFARGEPDPLPPLPVQYADYAVWQREQLQGEVLDRQVGYWKERMAGAPALLELPSDRPRPAVQSHRGARETFTLPRALLDGLQALGRGEGATLYMVMLSAFQLLLSKYSGSEDIVVGSPIAGRTRREVEELIGFFANTLVLRTDLGGDPTFRELLGRVREGTLGAYEHQEVPFERLVAELQPVRSLGHAPLFQVMFILQNLDRSGSGPGSGLAGLRMDGVAAEVTTTKVDLALTAIPHDGGVQGMLEYSTDLFDRSTVRRMLGHLERVLEQVVADADVRLSGLELLGEAERTLVLEEWNRTAADVPADRCIHELFEAQAARTPDAVALEFEGETLCYGALNARANRLAHHLAGLGVGLETRVGICLERGPEMIVAVLAVLKAGGAYVPLDPSYPAERLAYVMADAAVPVLVTQASLRGALPAGDGVAVVSVDGDRARIAAESAENPERGVSPDQLAYVIHTSGSTGRPKGVMVPHRGVPNLAYAQARRFGIDGSSRVLQFASLSFDAAVAEVFDALLSGAALVMAPREALLPGQALLETLRRGQVTVATLPPPVLAVLAPDDLPALRTVVSAGEAVDAATVERWSGGRAFVNAYGPTEVTVCATSAACEADGRVPAIGRPLENVRAYVLDAVGRPAPIGIPGELYVGGAGVVRGYLGRPGLTAERFVPDPFGDETGARLYRTGDRVRWSARGELEFLGRVDAQVKVRGFRIEPGEIEAVLSAHAEVRGARVIVREDVPGEKRLVAYVVGGVEAAGLRAHLRERLPEHMVPAAFVVLEQLPLTPNGKLDVRALPAPELASGEERYVAPRTPVEEVLAGIWAELLRLERVGVHDHFFELGGHSLLATRVVSRVRELFNVELPLRAVFEHPTVEGLAGVLAQRGAVAVAGPVSEPAAGPEANPHHLLAMLDELSEEELDRLLGAQP
jgi:amino acid adenylation domain-containing protein